MDRSSDRMFVAAAMLGWAGVGAYGVWEMRGQEAGDGWERPDLLFTVSPSSPWRHRWWPGYHHHRPSGPGAD